MQPSRRAEVRRRLRPGPRAARRHLQAPPGEVPTGDIQPMHRLSRDRGLQLLVHAASGLQALRRRDERHAARGVLVRQRQVGGEGQEG